MKTTKAKRPVEVSPAIPTLNVALLRKVQRRIKKEPLQFNMNFFFIKLVHIPNCGTAACIAGWTLALNAKKNPLETICEIDSNFIVNKHYTSNPDLADEAATILGIDYSQAMLLFYTYGWPQEFLFASDDDPSYIAKQACKRIDYFIKEGK